MCCLSRQKAAYVVSGSGVIVAIVSFVVAFYGLDEIVRNRIKQELVLKENGGDIYDYFVETPIDVMLKVYFFNITNDPLEMSPDWRPKLVETGPYMYRERRWKENITFTADGNKVDFYQYRSFEFDDSNGLSDNDVIVLPNAPVLGIMSMGFGQYPIEQLLEEPGPGIVAAVLDASGETDPYFMRGSVRDLMFSGQHSKILTHLMRILDEPFVPEALKDIPIPPNVVDLPSEDNGRGKGFAFYPKNNDHDGLFTIYTGKDGNMDRYQHIYQWEGNDHVDNWRTEECNRIRGTDGTAFKPFISKDDSLWVFATDACRSVRATFEREVQVQGIDGYRFVASAIDLANVSVNPNNLCFCVKPTKPIYNQTMEDIEGCMGAGVINLVTCTGVPVYLSLPHFLNGDEKYVQAVDGLKPDPAIHDTFLDVEPMTGFPLRGAKRAQMNLRVNNFHDDRLEVLSKLPEDLLLPIVWVEEFAELTPELADDFKSTLGVALEAVNIVKWVLVGLGVLGCVAFAAGFVQARRVKRRSKLVS